MSLAHLRATLSFNQMDTHFPNPHPQHPQHPQHPSPTSRSASVAARYPAQRIAKVSQEYRDRTSPGNRSLSVRRVSQLPLSQLPQSGTESPQPTYSISSENDSEDPIKCSSGFYNDDDEEDGIGPIIHPSRPPMVFRRRSSKHHRSSFLARLASRVRPSNNPTAHWRLPEADRTRNEHVKFSSEESSSHRLPSSEGTSEGPSSPHPSHLSSITADPAPSTRFSLYGLASRQAFSRRNRYTALLSPSREFEERHSSGTAESEWEDLGDTDHALGAVKRQARLTAWATLTSAVAPPVVFDNVPALSANQHDERPRDFLADLSLSAHSRTESISTASFEFDALPSVTSHTTGPYTPVNGQFCTSVWEETYYSAMRSSTELVRRSLDSVPALADLIQRLGLNDDGTEKHPLSSTAPGESKSTLDVPLHPVQDDTLFDNQPSVIPFAAQPPHPCPNCTAIPASHPSTFDHSPPPPLPPLPPLPSLPPLPPPLIQPPIRKDSNPHVHPTLDIGVNDLSVPMTSPPKRAPFHTQASRDRQPSDPFDPFGPGNESFLPDLSGSARAKKVKRAPPRAYTDPLPPPPPPPPPLDAPLPAAKKRKAQGGVPLPSSRSARHIPSHWPPVARSRSRSQFSSQDSLAVSSLSRSNTPKTSRSESRASKGGKGGWSLDRWFPPPPMGQAKDAH